MAPLNIRDFLFSKPVLHHNLRFSNHMHYGNNIVPADPRTLQPPPVRTEHILAMLAHTRGVSASGCFRDDGRHTRYFQETIIYTGLLPNGSRVRLSCTNCWYASQGDAGAPKQCTAQPDGLAPHAPVIQNPLPVPTVVSPVPPPQLRRRPPQGPVSQPNLGATRPTGTRATSSSSMTDDAIFQTPPAGRGSMTEDPVYRTPRGQSRSMTEDALYQTPTGPSMHQQNRNIGAGASSRSDPRPPRPSGYGSTMAQPQYDFETPQYGTSHGDWNALESPRQQDTSEQGNSPPLRSFREIGDGRYTPSRGNTPSDYNFGSAMNSSRGYSPVQYEGLGDDSPMYSPGPQNNDSVGGNTAMPLSPRGVPPIGSPMQLDSRAGTTPYTTPDPISQAQWDRLTNRSGPPLAPRSGPSSPPLPPITHSPGTTSRYAVLGHTTHTQVGPFIPQRQQVPGPPLPPGTIVPYELWRGSTPQSPSPPRPGVPPSTPVQSPRHTSPRTAQAPPPGGNHTPRLGSPLNPNTTSPVQSPGHTSPRTPQGPPPGGNRTPRLGSPLNPNITPITSITERMRETGFSTPAPARAPHPASQPASQLQEYRLGSPTDRLQDEHDRREREWNHRNSMFQQQLRQLDEDRAEDEAGRLGRPLGNQAPGAASQSIGSSAYEEPVQPADVEGHKRDWERAQMQLWREEESPLADPDRARRIIRQRNEAQNAWDTYMRVRRRWEERIRRAYHLLRTPIREWRAERRH
jgi:hypothetical protein